MNDASNENVELSSNNSNEVATLENKPIETKTQKALRITNIVVNVIFYIFIAILLLFSISQIAGSKDKKVKNVFGLGYEVVASDSMKPAFKKNDLIWVKTNFKEKDLKVGTIATFWDMYSSNPTNNSKGFLNTHRIVDVVDLNKDGKVEFYVLQGDYKKGTVDDYSTWTDAQKEAAWYNYQYASGPIQIVQSSSDFSAIYVGHWDGAGSFINWLSNPKKGFILVIVFTGIFLLFEMFMVIKNIMDIRTAKMISNKEAEKEEMKMSLEAEREKMKQELLAQLKAEQETLNSSANVDKTESENVENTDSEKEDDIEE